VNAFRDALRATLGWDATACGPAAEEAAEIAIWRGELAEPIERGRPRIDGGIKLNAALCLVRDARSGESRIERTIA
jgi:hypothetical protein